MLYKINNFENKTPSTISKEQLLLACGSNIDVYTIETIHDLIQFIGYGKYMNNHEHNVYLRGQTSLYNGSLIPSIYRGRNKYDAITTKYNSRINAAIHSNASFRQYDRKIFDPLLQHYGIKTNQIDVVDNVWVALWFALHQAKCEVINSHEYIYYYHVYLLVLHFRMQVVQEDHNLSNKILC